MVSFREISKPRHTLINGNNEEIVNMELYKKDIQENSEKWMFYCIAKEFGIEDTKNMTQDEFYEAYAFVEIINKTSE